VLVCSDDSMAAAAMGEEVHRALGTACTVVQWARVQATSEWADLVCVWSALAACQPHAKAACGAGDSSGGGGGDEARMRLFLDWWAMTQAETLAISNSTFSFTAAMLNRHSAPHVGDTTSSTTTAASSSSMACGPGCFVRPVPEVRALQSFDPWNSYPLLTCADSQVDELYGEQGAYG